MSPQLRHLFGNDAWISQQLRDDTTVDIEKVLEDELTAQARSRGYVVVAGTFRVKWYDRNGPPGFEPFRALLPKGDQRIAAWDAGEVSVARHGFEVRPVPAMRAATRVND